MQKLVCLTHLSHQKRAFEALFLVLNEKIGFWVTATAFQFLLQPFPP